MPARLLREGILDSEAVNALTAEAEVFYRRLMSAVDDFGRYDGRPAMLRCRLYPLRLDTVGVTDVSRWLAECVRAGLVRLYEVGGKPYLLYLKLGPARAKVSKYPPPPDGPEQTQTPADIPVQVKADANSPEQMKADESGCAQMRPYSGSGSGSDAGSGAKEEQEPPLPPATGGGGRRPDPVEHPLFPRFWEAYPRKAKKRDAAQAFAKLAPDPGLLDVLLAAVADQRTWEQWRKDGGQFVPYPATWLNGRRWEDEPPKATGPPPPGRKPFLDKTTEYAVETLRDLFEDTHAGGPDPDPGPRVVDTTPALGG